MDTADDWISETGENPSVSWENHSVTRENPSESDPESQEKVDSLEENAITRDISSEMPYNC